MVLEDMPEGGFSRPGAVEVQSQEQASFIHRETRLQMVDGSAFYGVFCAPAYHRRKDLLRGRFRVCEDVPFDHCDRSGPWNTPSPEDLVRVLPHGDRAGVVTFPGKGTEGLDKMIL